MSEEVYKYIYMYVICTVCIFGSALDIRCSSDKVLQKIVFQCGVRVLLNFYITIIIFAAFLIDPPHSSRIKTLNMFPAA